MKVLISREVLTDDKLYVANKSCSMCEENCENNMCDCKGLRCLNGGILNLKTCSCTCPYSLYTGKSCENCEPA
jgi:hypothetical protein